MMKSTEFYRDDKGAVTIEWVALAAGVLLLAFGVIAVLDRSIDDTAATIGAAIGGNAAGGGG